jgi:acetylglutamate kinase
MSGVLVVKVGGATLEDAEASPRLLDAIAGLSRRGPVVLVHGGGRAVDRQLAKLGMETRRHEGLRITPAEQIEQIAGVLAGSENKRVVGELLARGVRAVGLSLGDGNAVATRRMRLVGTGGVDLGHVGQLATTDAAGARDGEGGGGGGGANLLRVLCGHGFVPVVCSIGIDATERIAGTRLLNVNADDAAAGVARAIKASGGVVDALVLLTDVAGVLDAKKQRIETLDAAAIEALVCEGVVSGGMLVKVRAAHATAVAIGTPVVIASGTDAASLEALGRGMPEGTRILPE